MSKHTPGPWHSTARIAGEDHPIYDECAHTIAIVRGKDVVHSTSIANARLIAAAPDLLDACRAALSELGSFCHAYNVNPEIQPAMVQLRAAIDGTTTNRDALAARLTLSHPTQEHAHE